MKNVENILTTEKTFEKELLIGNSNRKRAIYLAGFDVFSIDSDKIGRELKEVCSKYGFTGRYPLDNEIQTTKDMGKHSVATKIFEANVALLKSCDIVVANLNPFRGGEVDTGTAFECGLAYAFGKPIYGYILDAPGLLDVLCKRIQNCVGVWKDKETGRYIDSEGFYVEDFGLPVNLMISVPATIFFGSAENCIKNIAKLEDISCL